MSQVVPPPGSDHSIWELEKATLQTPSNDPVRQVQTGLNCAEPSLPDLAFSPDWVPFAAETLVGTASHWRLFPCRDSSFLVGRVGGSEMLSGRTRPSQ